MSQNHVIDLNESEIYWRQPLDGQSNMDTRSAILFAAYKEIHLNGFQSASLNNILAHTGVTKGALYHHFPNKTELGYAVVDEVLAEHIHRSFVEPLQEAEDPVEALIGLIQQSGDAFTLRDIELGCPLSNLVQEMAAIDEGFRVRLSRIYESWLEAIEKAITQGQQSGLIIDSVEPKQVAAMVVATMDGCLGAGKISQDLDKLLCCGAGLIQYLNLIRQK